jgi:orotidine-5'-phosphate decarboxylase
MNRTRKMIPALDITDLEQIKELIKKIDDSDFIYGYKAGFSLGLTHGLPKVVDAIRSVSDKPIIYDHQKAATDIPDTGKLFNEIMKNSGINEVILFPQAGPVTLKAWVEAVIANDMKVIVGGIMTHPAFVESEGGFIRDEAVTEIYKLAYENGARDFVVPLTKSDATRKLYETAGLDESCNFYSPGYGKQGGDPAQFDFIKTHYIIVGRALFAAADPAEYVRETEEELLKIV